MPTMPRVNCTQRLVRNDPAGWFMGGINLPERR
jgi:hypothetical protein